MHAAMKDYIVQSQRSLYLSALRDLGVRYKHQGTKRREISDEEKEKQQRRLNFDSSTTRIGQARLFYARTAVPHVGRKYSYQMA